MMRIVNASAEILTPLNGPEVLKTLEACGRLSWKSEDKTTDESAPKFIQMLLKAGHESVIEHVNASVRFIVDRGVSHELVRHRLMSVTQESTRYVSYADDGKHGGLTFIRPIYWNDGSPEYCVWVEMMEHVESAYNGLINMGATPQEARAVLPNSVKTELIVTANLREWRHILKLRTAKGAHPQMREVCIPLLAEFKRQVPVIFDDVTLPLNTA